MRILWVCPAFLHPTRGGGQILSLEILRRLHRRHEIHFVAFDRLPGSDSVRRSSEYCTRAYPVPVPAPSRVLRPYVLELVRQLVAGEPMDARFHRISEQPAAVARLMSDQQFDAYVCENAYCLPALPKNGRWVVLQHNIHSILIDRRARHEDAALVRLCSRIDAWHMAALERRVCAEAAQVIAVSESDAETMRRLYGAPRVTAIHIGVDTCSFLRPSPLPLNLPRNDLVFLGSMNWQPNVDGANWFVKDVLPLIRRQRPDCSLALAGQNPQEGLRALGLKDPQIRVTGTLTDVRPWLWGGNVSIAPILHGSGVRLKLYESMAAGIPVVSTSIGAEGLPVRPGEHLRIADDPAAFAAEILDLLENREAAAQMAARARTFVERFADWDQTAAAIEDLLLQLAPGAI